MSIRFHISVASVVLTYFLAACKSMDSQRPSKLSSFHQWEEASLLLEPFWSLESFSVSKPNIPSYLKGKEITKAQFEDLNNSIQIKKEFAVVVLSKKMEGRTKEELDEIELWLLNLGFKRVVIQVQASIVYDSNLPILRDTDKKKPLPKS